MDYNFADFLKESRNKCKTREDFLVRVTREIDLATKDPGNPQFYVDKKSYLRRLEGARLATLTYKVKEPDKYNDELMRLLNGLL